LLWLDVSFYSLCLSEKAELAEGHQTFGILLVGYPEYRYYRQPLRKKPQLSWS
jgi:hypothetical protein